MIPPIETSSNDYCFIKAERDYREKPLYQRIFHVIQAVFRAIWFILKLIPGHIKFSMKPHPSYCTLPEKDHKWKEGNRGLYVIITGLNAHPAWAENHISQIEKQQPEMEIRVPFVHRYGNCSLDSAAQPIIELVRDYIKEHPGHPICLIGASNGGRIAGKVESALRGEGAAIRVSAIAGVFFGSSRMNKIAALKIASRLYAPEIIEDLQVGSKVSKNLIDAMRMPLADGDVRHFEFFAASNDEFIPNFSSCLAILNQGEEFHLLEGETHLSIVDAVRDRQLSKAHLWMKAAIAAL